MVTKLDAMRLREAVDAMRDFGQVRTENWKQNYPTFAEAVDRIITNHTNISPLIAMNIELNLRLAEVACQFIGER